MTTEERLEAIEKVVFALEITECTRCGGRFQEWAGNECGPRCMSCGNREFRRRKVYD